MTRTALAALLAACACAFAGCNGGGQEASTGAIEVGECHIGGCSGELCSREEGAVSPCIYKPEYSCYRTAAAVCEPQQDGQCGWTSNPDLTACLQSLAP